MRIQDATLKRQSDLRSQNASKDASNRNQNKANTYDCAFLEPEAFPPDFPPVILIDLVGGSKKGGFGTDELTVKMSLGMWASWVALCGR